MSAHAGNPFTVSRNIDWRVVLEFFGIARVPSFLPADVECPQCKQPTLRLYDDSTYTGVWLHCRNCRFAGDIVEACAAWWNTDLNDALARMSSEGLRPRTEAVSSYLLNVAKRRRIAAAWNNAAQFTSGMPDLRSYLRDLNLAVDHADYHSRLQQLIRSTINENCENLVPKSVAWREFLIVPGFDLPGRTPSWWACNAAGATHHAVAGQHSGLLFSQVLESASAQTFGGVVVMLDDVLTALRLHDRHFRLSSEPLPLLAAFSDKPSRPPSGWLGSNVVIWCASLTSEAILLARHLKAKVTTSAEADPVHRFEQYSADGWLKQILTQAMPWPQALAKYAAAASAAECRRTLHEASYTIEEHRQNASSMPDNLRVVLDPYFAASLYKSVTHRGHFVEERDGAWYCDGALCTKTLLRIDTVARSSDDEKRLRYHGRIIDDGFEIPFTDIAYHFDIRFSSWLSKTMLLAGRAPKTIPKIIRPIDLAMQLHPPAIVDMEEHVGWSEKNSQFAFSNFTISSGGRLGPGTGITAPVGWPTRSLEMPQVLTDADLTKLNNVEDPAATALWALAAVVVGNVLAPVLGKPMIGTAVVGGAAHTALFGLGCALGCAHEQIGEYNGYARIRKFDSLSQRHSWPTFLETTRSRVRPLGQWLTEAEERNVLVAVDRYASIQLATVGHWHEFCVDQAIGSVAAYRGVASKIIPAYLLWLCRQELRLDRADTYIDAVLDSMAAWFRSTGGRAATVLAARQHLMPDDYQANDVHRTARMVGLLLRAFMEDELLVDRSGLPARHQSLMAIVAASNEVRLKRQAINRITDDSSLVSLDADSYELALRRTGALLRTGKTRSSSWGKQLVVWALSRGWWNEFVCVPLNKAKKKLA